MSSFANMWNDSNYDEDYMTYFDLQLDCGTTDIDPLYKVFLEHLREDGFSYILEMPNDFHGSQTFIKYEDENELSEETGIELQRCSEGISYKNDRTENGPKKFSHKKRRQEPAESMLPLDSEGMSGALIDESYQIFLRHLRFEDGSIVLDWKSRAIRYEEVNEKSNSSGPTSESQNSEQGMVSYESSVGRFDVTKVDDGPIVTYKFSEPFQFRKNLDALLAQPFDKNEYEHLWKEITDRKPLKKQKELRSRSISYATDRVGKSYLDRYADLEEQLESADCNRRLQLLRGFFFWLKNLCHKGAFMPWSLVNTDSDTLLTSGCEVVVPPSDEDMQVALPSNPMF